MDIRERFFIHRVQIGVETSASIRVLLRTDQFGGLLRLGGTLQIGRPSRRD